MTNLVIAIEAAANKPRSWGGDGILKIQGTWFSTDFSGRLVEYNGPIEKYREGPFPAKNFGATALAGAKWLNDRRQR